MVAREGSVTRSGCQPALPTATTDLSPFQVHPGTPQNAVFQAQDQLASQNQSQNHRITEWSGLEGTSVDLLVHPPYQSRVTYSRLHRTSSRQVLNISREGDSAAPLGSLFQCSVTLKGKNFFLVFIWNFLCCSLCRLPLVLLLGTTENSLAPLSWHRPLRYL